MIAIALMIVGAFAFVAYPFFKPVRELDIALGGTSDPVLENLVLQRDATYAAIKDLEFDHAMGKLSDADYGSMRSKYESKAVAILQELDGLSASLKQRARAAFSDEAIERQVQQLRGGAGNIVYCTRCGTRAAPGDKYCAKCGTPVNR
ncbi:MAG: zinc ribbon domain-containing protein [Chloroflexota bacterium]|nr:zinc ribbon domain-containing protein [Chloroflexota bacterium]